MSRAASNLLGCRIRSPQGEARPTSFRLHPKPARRCRRPRCRRSVSPTRSPAEAERPRDGICGHRQPMGRSTPRLKSRMRKAQPRGSVFDLASFDRFVEVFPASAGARAACPGDQAVRSNRPPRRTTRASRTAIAPATYPPAVLAREKRLFVSIDSIVDFVTETKPGPMLNSRAQGESARRSPRGAPGPHGAGQVRHEAAT